MLKYMGEHKISLVLIKVHQEACGSNIDGQVTIGIH